jgi:predicted nucleic acid-binding protein
MIRKVYLDANIIVAVINNEYPVLPDCAKVLSLCTDVRFRVYTSPLCLGIAFYYAQKKTSTQNALAIIKNLSEKILVVSNTEYHIKQTLANNKILDFEDGMQYYAAMEAGCHAIVTHNQKDFHFSEISIFSAKDYLVDTFC